ncbi:ADP-ribosylglycohydrolase family protein [Desulfurobacterium thermolithotrophum]|uniref:ADP-ribosylglycohydrolase family protein n=1 Tax=Desulfurobacterium thermolithotrophum TaxID=64160 RepID=UPI0013D5E2FC|nr:ADP-ribosylglycohydrolase family protein [Desulfurobacterium thermolithotrophum]
METLYEKIKGATLGAAIGDALGTLVEEMDRDTVKKAYGGAIIGFTEPSPLSVCPYLKKGQYSHETQIFLLALEVFAEKGRFDEELYINKLIEWVKDEKSHRYPAGSHINAALAYASGADGAEARVKSADIDGAIPALAAGIFRWDSSYESYEEGAKIASITHNDETLIDTAGVLAVAVSEVIGGRVILSTKEDRIGFVEVLRSFAQTEIVRAYLDMVTQVILKGIESIDDLILLLGNGSFAPEAFSIALFIAMENSNSYRKGVLKAVNSYGDFGGDTDAIAFITGGLIGGYLGVSAIPQDWLNCLENSNYFDLILRKLMDKF